MNKDDDVDVDDDGEDGGSVESKTETTEMFGLENFFKGKKKSKKKIV